MSSCALLALGIALCMGRAPLWRLAVGMLIIGLTIAHGVFLQHQAMHNTGFRSRRANEFWGVVLGIPALVSFYEYRVSHFFHHANHGTPAQNELYRFLDWETDKPRRAQTLLVKYHVRWFLSNLWLVLRGRPLEHHVFRYTRVQQRQFRRFYIIASGFIFLLAVLSWTFKTWLPLAAWLGALVLVAMPVHGLFEFPEHIGCDLDTTDVFRNTRSTRSNSLVQWLVHYDNLHAEHHLEPKTAFYLLPEVHRKISGLQKACSAGYIDYYIDYFKSIRPRLKRNFVQQ